MKKIQFTEALLWDVYHTVLAIASDIHISFDNCDNEELLEGAIDADRILEYGRPDTKIASQAELIKLYEVHGYDKVLKALNEVPRLKFIG